MADPQYTDAQLSDGTTVRLMGNLSPDQVRDKVTAYRLKRPDLFGAPSGIQAPQPNMQQMPIPRWQQGALPDPGLVGLASQGREGYASDPDVSGAMSAAGAATGAAMTPWGRALLSKAKVVVPPMLAGAGYKYARENLPGGQYLPSAGDWLIPLLTMGQMPSKDGGKQPAETEQPPPVSTDQVPGRPYQPNPRYQPQPQPEPLPQRTGPLLLKGEVQAPPPPTNYKKLPWMPELEKSLGNQPGEIKPGVPMRQQQIAQPAKESSVIGGSSYDPQAREFHVQTKSGGGYIYGDVSPEDAQAFDSAESKGKAWQQIKSNPLVGKIVNGKRVDVKPVTRDAGDLTDILTQSLQAVKAKK